MELIKSLISKLPLNKIKLYLSLAGILLIVGLFINLGIVIRKNAKIADNMQRILRNQLQLTGENRQLQNYIFRQSEVNGQLKREVDSLARELSVKPKYITRIEYRTISEIDTVDKIVYVDKIAEGEWFVSDTGQCFVWSGTARLKDSDLEVTRDSFEYENKITDVFYRKKPDGFFGFLKRRVNYHSVQPECGTASVVTFEFIK